MRRSYRFTGRAALGPKRAGVGGIAPDLGCGMGGVGKCGPTRAAADCTGGTPGRAATAAGRACGAGCPCGAGRTRFGSLLSSRVVVPAGPVNVTSYGAMLSRCHAFTVSPSERTSGFSPFTAKIAVCRSGSITIPVSLTSVSPGSAGPPETARSAGRHVPLNSGRLSVAATSSLMRGLCVRCAEEDLYAGRIIYYQESRVHVRRWCIGAWARIAVDCRKIQAHA
jgi:hypothetical protein